MLKDWIYSQKCTQIYTYYDFELWWGEQALDRTFCIYRYYRNNFCQIHPTYASSHRFKKLLLAWKFKYSSKYVGMQIFGVFGLNYTNLKRKFRFELMIISARNFRKLRSTRRSSKNERQSWWSLIFGGKIQIRMSNRINELWNTFSISSIIHKLGSMWILLLDL